MVVRGQHALAAAVFDVALRTCAFVDFKLQAESPDTPMDLLT